MAFFRWLKRVFGFGAVSRRPMAGGSAVAELLARTRDLSARNAQWPAIWAVLNPRGVPAIQQLLVDLRNDGLQFAPSDGLRRIELTCEELENAPHTGVEEVLRRVLGKTDVLDHYR